MNNSHNQFKRKQRRKASNSANGSFPRTHNGGPPLEKKQQRGGYYYALHLYIDDPVVGFGEPVKPADPSRPARTRFEAWHWMLSNASFETQEIFVQGRPMTLNRGDLCGAYSYLADQWNWTPNQVRWFVNKLEKKRHVEKLAAELQAQGAHGDPLKSLDKTELNNQPSQPLSQPPHTPLMTTI
jgi:hypothetical protein